MSLRLALGTQPTGLEIKTWGGIAGRGNAVYLGDYEISLADFLLATEYVLTNADLEPNDLRRQFVKCVQSMHEVDGFNTNTKRLFSPVSAVLLN